MRNMESEAFSRGDILFDLGKLADEMCFVARGNLYILSGEDFDSPIVTLGQGSLIGQINLIYSKTTKFKVNFLRRLNFFLILVCVGGRGYVFCNLYFTKERLLDDRLSLP